jgi:UDPglucose 6-dehydrogenase
MTVFGLWHLGRVTKACCAKDFRVNGLDFDVATIARLSSGASPLFEPGLDDFLKK